MKPDLFPSDIIQNSQESNFKKHSTRSKVIYSSTLFVLITLLFTLPFIHVDVGIRSQGLIRPSTDFVQLRAPVSGTIEALMKSENSYIQSGELFIVLEASLLREQMRFNENRQQLLNSYIEDLTALERLDPKNLDPDKELGSARYRRSLIEFRQEANNLQIATDRASRNYYRSQTLFDRNVISEAAMEEAHSDYLTAKNRMKILLEQQQNQWLLDKVSFRQELEQLESDYHQLKQNIAQYEIRSPVSGTIHNVEGIYQNSFVAVNQVLADVSPDTTLIAEAYISPGQVGLLREGLPARLQIDAYNHHQWGVASGVIESISRDVTLIDGRPMFKVRCTLNQSHLQLQNGVKGEIRKGMTFQARFIVARRSLFQLLYDKADDWLNPSWGETEVAAHEQAQLHP
jgi:membrane fusion protein, peptide pheromone/bacteriocin exporter